MKMILLILDGWGYSPYREGNAIAKASLPAIRYIESCYPFGLLKASGISVGLPWGESGNSEVGHLTLGSGRAVLQYMPRIVQEIQQGSFFFNSALLAAVKNAKDKKSYLHLVGMVGSGSVHSYIDHLYALLELTSRHGLSWKVRLHLFTDGKDSPPQQAASLLRNLQERLSQTKQGEISTIIGRDYGMDRNFFWENTQKAFNLLVKGEGMKTHDVVATMQEYYEKGISDNAIPPIRACDSKGRAREVICDQDSVIFFNFREDSERQLAKALILPSKAGFEAQPPKDILFVMFTRYEKNLPGLVAFEPPQIHNTLADVLETFSKTQLHIAETEKYAHATYFFNGLREDTHRYEEWSLIPSHQEEDGVEGSEGIAQLQYVLLNAVQGKRFDFIVANFAKADAVGHLGNLDVAIRVCERIDEAIGEVVRLIEKQEDYGCIITSDHGHIERMTDPRTAEIATSHTTNDVPIYFIYPSVKKERGALETLTRKKEGLGLLADIAPTILELMGIPSPPEMTGKSFLPSLLQNEEE